MRIVSFICSRAFGPRVCVLCLCVWVYLRARSTANTALAETYPKSFETLNIGIVATNNFSFDNRSFTFIASTIWPNSNTHWASSVHLFSYTHTNKFRSHWHTVCVMCISDLACLFDSGKFANECNVCEWIYVSNELAGFVLVMFFSSYYYVFYLISDLFRWIQCTQLNWLC